MNELNIFMEILNDYFVYLKCSCKFFEEKYSKDLIYY